MKIYYHNNVKFIVGCCAKDNDMIVKNLEPDDLWFHIADEGSPHVQLQNTTSHDITLDNIRYACALCKVFSKQRNRAHVKVLYAYGKDIKATKQLGSVQILTQPFSLFV